MAGERHIISWGGAKSAKSQDNIPMLAYMLRHARREKPRVLITGPGYDETAQGYKYFTFFSQFDCRISHLSLFYPPTTDLAGFVLEKDLIYVGGGNTKAMLALWREFGLDKAFKEAWKEGVVLSGVSAGAICWFEQCMSDTFPGQITPMKCLGLLSGSCAVHYDTSPLTPDALHDSLIDGTVKPGYAIEDDVALHFTGTELHKVISLAKGPVAYKTGVREGTVRLEKMEPVLLEPDGHVDGILKRRE